jgi:GTP pyrophosphokinase
LRFDLGQDQVYVFTPKGEVLSLPAGSTPVDFAYTIHTEVGHRTMGAKVNDRLVPLNTELKNSDRVEILTSKNEGSGPSQDWLNFVKSPKARNKIRAWFSKSRKEEDIERGRDELAKILRTQNLPTNRLFSHEVLSEVAEDLKYQNVDMLYAAIGTGGISAKSVLRKLIDSTREDIQGEIVDEKPAVKKAIDDPRPTTPSTNPGISVSGVEGENDVWIKLAKCCLPVPGDLIIGFVTQGSGISIHRQDCFNIAELKKEMDPSRFIEANWIKDAVTSFMVQIQIEGLDRANLLADVTRVLSENHVSIISGSVETTKDRVALSKWTFEMSDPKHLAVILSSIRKIDGVFDVYRLTGRSV